MSDLITRTVGDTALNFSDTFKVDGAALDLTTATALAFKMRARNSATLKVNAAASNNGAPTTGGVKYTPLPADVDTAGDYQAWWVATFSGSAPLSTPEFTVRFVDHVLTADLCTVSDVRLEIEQMSLVKGQDALIASYIREASVLIMRETGREFAPATASATRRFAVPMNRVGSGMLRVDLHPYDLRTASAVVLNPEDAAPSTLATTDYALAPLPSLNGTYYRLLINRYYVPALSNFALRFGYAQVDVTGAWGFASVPEQVRSACVDTVAAWMNRAAPSMGTGAEDSAQIFQTLAGRGSYAIPLKAKTKLEMFRRRAGT